MLPSANARDPRRNAQWTVKALVMVAGVLATVTVISIFFSGRATTDLQRSRRRVDTLRADIQKLEHENSRLRREIDSARQSTYAVEKIAREDLGMSRKGEVIYMLPTKR